MRKPDEEYYLSGKGEQLSKSEDGKNRKYLPLLRIAYRLGIVWCIGGMVLFVSTAVLAAVGACGVSLTSTWMRFPLGDIDRESVDVDSKGNIYCASRFYSRIQVYSPQGDFISGWFIKPWRGDLYPEVDENDLLCIRRGGTWYKYDLHGNLVEDPPDETRFALYDSVDEGEYVSLAGKGYRCRGTSWRPRIVRVLEDGSELTVVRDPSYLWVFSGPWPAFVWIFVGGIPADCIAKIEGVQKRSRPKKSRANRKRAEPGSGPGGAGCKRNPCKAKKQEPEQ